MVYGSTQDILQQAFTSNTTENNKTQQITQATKKILNSKENYTIPGIAREFLKQNKKKIIE